MPIDTENKRRSVAGYTNSLSLPVADATMNAGDREHVAYLYRGIIAGAPAVIVIELPYAGDTTIYDSAGVTGGVSGGAVQPSEAIYDSAGASGSVSGGAVQPPDVSYD